MNGMAWCNDGFAQSHRLQEFHRAKIFTGSRLHCNVKKTQIGWDVLMRQRSCESNMSVQTVLLNIPA